MKHSIRNTVIWIFCTCFLASCGAEDTMSVTETVSQEIQQETAVEWNADTILQQYPTNGMHEIKILTTNNVNSTLFARTAPEEEITGELVNDALYTRDRMLEEYFQTKLIYDLVSEDIKLIDPFTTAALAGDDAYSFMIGSLRWAAIPAFNQGVCYDLSDMQVIDLTQPWWSQNVMENFIYEDHYYLLVGEFSPRNVLSGNILMFNLQEHANRNLPSLYDMVREGTWTYDAFCSIVQGIGTDLDGDGNMTLEDFYGLNCDSTAGHSFYFGMGQNLIVNADGKLQAAVNTDQAVSVLENLQKLFTTADINADSYRKNTYAPNESFMENKALFNCMVVLDLSMFRDYETDYGIVPLPKYDEMQQSYCSFANVSAMTAVVIPKSLSVEKLQNTGTFIEAMTALSHYKSIPEAYDATLLSRETRDEDSVEMLRIISEGLMLDLGAVYNIGGLYTMLEECTVDGKPVVSTYQGLENGVQTDCSALVEAFLGNSAE